MDPTTVPDPFSMGQWFQPQQAMEFPQAADIPAAMPPEQAAAYFVKAGISPQQAMPAIQAAATPPIGQTFNPTQPTTETAPGSVAMAQADPAATAKPAQAVRSPFQGLAPPKAPEPQKVSTPAAPRPTGTIKSGELMALLQTLGMGGGGGAGGAYKPLGLKQAIGSF